MKVDSARVSRKMCRMVAKQARGGIRIPPSKNQKVRGLDLGDKCGYLGGEGGGVKKAHKKMA